MRRITAILLLCAGCATEPLQAPAPGVVAVVGDDQIHAAQLRAHAEQVPITLLSSTQVDSARQQYLRGLLVRRLLAREVVARGLDTTRAVTQRVATAQRKRMSEIYLREQVWPLISVDKARVQAFYDSLGLRRQRKVAGIVLATRAEAQGLRRDLLAGANFEKLASRLSKHPLSAANGGELGYVTARQARSIGIPTDIFADLPDSAISAILPLGEEFQVIRFLDTRDLPIEQFVEDILDVLMNQEREKVEAEHLVSLGSEYGWHPVEEAIKVLDRRTGGNMVLQPQMLAPAELALPLFAYADTAITIGQLLEAAQQNRREVSSGSAAVEIGHQILRNEHLYAEAARRQQIDQRPEIIEWVRTLIEELSISELRRQVLAQGSPPTPDEIQATYTDNPDLFRENDDILIVETLLATEDEAQAVRDAVDGGEDLLTLASRTTTRTGVPSDARGMLRLNEHERMTNSVLYAAVQQASLDEVVGPIAVQDGFSVFRIIERQQGELLPFLQVEQRVKAFARRFKQTYAFERFIEELLERYEDQTQVFESELVLALPDSLVDRIARRDQARAGLAAAPN